MGNTVGKLVLRIALKVPTRGEPALTGSATVPSSLQTRTTEHVGEVTSVCDGKASAEIADSATRRRMAGRDRVLGRRGCGIPAIRRERTYCDEMCRFGCKRCAGRWVRSNQKSTMTERWVFALHAALTRRYAVPSGVFCINCSSCRLVQSVQLKRLRVCPIVAVCRSEQHQSCDSGHLMRCNS